MQKTRDQPLPRQSFGGRLLAKFSGQTTHGTQRDTTNSFSHKTCCWQPQVASLITPVRCTQKCFHAMLVAVRPALYIDYCDRCLSSLSWHTVGMHLIHPWPFVSITWRTRLVDFNDDNDICFPSHKPGTPELKSWIPKLMFSFHDGSQK